MNLAHLHCHSTFSFLDAHGTPEDIVKAAKERGFNAVALTDHGNVSGWIQLNKHAHKAKIKPIFGIEVYMVSDVASNTQKKNHLTLLAKNLAGYKSLLALTSASYADGFYYRPTVDFNMLEEHADGVVCLSGCASGLVMGGTINKDHATVRGAIEAFKRIYGDDFYIEVQTNGYVPAVKAGAKLLTAADKANLPAVLTNDVHYVNPNDKKIRDILWCIRDRIPISAAQYDNNENLCLMEPDGMLDVAKALYPKQNGQVAAAWAAIDHIVGMIDEFEIPTVPEVKYPGIVDADDVLLRLCRRGWNRRGLSSSAYAARVKHELKLIKQKGFANYFLIIADLVVWAKKAGILVGVRGSVAGSLVCYLIEISEVDPIKHGLIFERFIDINRHDLPDIDLDFESERRTEAKDYLAQKYGTENVGDIGTFAQFKGKNSLDEIGKVFRVPINDVKIIKDRLVERSGGDSRADLTIEDTINRFPQAQEITKKFPAIKLAQQLEGNYRHMGVHAAGVVVSSIPVREFAGVYTRNTNGKMSNVLSFDKKDLEDLGAMKIDLLGLKTMSMLRVAMDRLGLSDTFFYELGLEDPDTLKGFYEEDLLGIFQFDGDSTRSVTAQVKPETFEELIDINALSRPGPLHCGATTDYIAFKHTGRSYKGAKPSSIKALRTLTKDTQYQVIFQEQVMRVMREVGHMTWRDTSEIRRLISKSEGVERFNDYRDRFLKGAIGKSGVPKKDAEELWEHICTFGSWAFNKAHSVCYTLVSYWTMWLKRHHSEVFYWASISVENDDRRVSDLLREFVNRGGIVHQPLINNSGIGWSLDEDGAIRAGLTSIKGIGEKTANAIISQGPFDGISDFLKKLPKRQVNKRVKALLYDAGALQFEDIIEDDDFLKLNQLSEKLEEVHRTHKIKEIQFGGGSQYIILAGVIKERNLRDIHEISKSRHALGNISAVDVKTMREPDLTEFLNLTLADEESSIICSFDRFTYPRFKDEMWEAAQDNEVVVVRGIKADNFRKVYAQSFKRTGQILN